MNAVVEHESPRLPSLQSGGAVRAIVPQDFEGAWRIATAVCKAGMAPKGLDTAEKAMVAIMHGMEVGMTPMAALQSIAVVNGRPTIWGDGAIGLVRGSGKCEWIKERIDGEGDVAVAVCEVKRKGEADPIKATFSVADAKKANLWGKQGPWQQYPKRMLAMRARAFALRDAFADVLRGLGIAEEVQDFQPIHNATPPTPPKPPAPPRETIEHTRQADGVTETIDAETGEVVDEREIVEETGEQTAAVMDEGDETVGDYFERMEAAMQAATNAVEIAEVWNDFDPLAKFENDEESQSLATSIKRRHVQRVGGKDG